MPAGLEVYNSAGVPQIINRQGNNYVAYTKGTINIGSNGNANGATGRIDLPQSPYNYLVFIRTGGNARAFGGVNYVNWYMAQGTASFDYWIYVMSTQSGNVGMQVFNPDGSLQWDATQRPLQMLGMVNKNGQGSPQILVNFTGNFVQGPGFGGMPTNAAYLFSDAGGPMEVYQNTASGAGGNVIRANQRFGPCINTPDANTFYMNFARYRSNPGQPGTGVSHTGYAGGSPSFILMATTW